MGAATCMKSILLNNEELLKDIYDFDIYKEIDMGDGLTEKKTTVSVNANKKAKKIEKKVNPFQKIMKERKSIVDFIIDRFRVFEN